MTTCRRHDDCPERPCRVCRREHVTHNGHGTDHTCATCLHETRQNLAELGNLAAAMLGEAIIRGLQSQAAVLAGPTADPSKWHRRAVLIAKAATYADAKTPAAARLDALLEDNRDEPHPGWILRDWERQVRDHLDQATDDPATLTDARRYLDGHLTRLAHDDTFAFEEMKRDIQNCREHCEAILRSDEQIERGATCPTCQRKRVVKIYDEHSHHWACDCGHVLTDDQHQEHAERQRVATADRLTIPDMAVRTGVSPASLWKWTTERKVQREGEKPVIHKPLLHSCGLDGKDRKLYRVSKVEAIRDNGGDTRGRTTEHTSGKGANVQGEGAA